MDESQPKLSAFMKHIFSMQTAALMFMGKIQNPITKTDNVDFDQAKQIINTLIALRDKTKGNLTENEDRTINSILTQVQYSFVEETILKKKDKNNTQNNNNLQQI